ncbi:class I SAM-dependent methyltransferase [Solimonas sp. K1W22B-7]|nr:class I SAM-dependent methyltransferase [Solimonas sp. K1W22B-7]
MFDLFMDWAHPSSEDVVLDLGVTPDESLPESNFFERHYPYPARLIAASIEDASNLARAFPGVTFRQIEPGPLPFPDKAFRYLFCSAVVEHVGTREDQRRFLAELSRVSEAFFVTTPNRWFPVEFHTILPLIHWLPQRLHQRLLRLLGLGRWADTQMLNLLSGSELTGLFPAGAEVVLKRIRLAGMTSNLVVMGRS